MASGITVDLVRVKRPNNKEQILTEFREEVAARFPAKVNDYSLDDDFLEVLEWDETGAEGGMDFFEFVLKYFYNSEMVDLFINWLVWLKIKDGEFKLEWRKMFLDEKGKAEYCLDEVFRNSNRKFILADSVDWTMDVYFDNGYGARFYPSKQGVGTWLTLNILYRHPHNCIWDITAPSSSSALEESFKYVNFDRLSCSDVEQILKKIKTYKDMEDNK